MFLSVLCFYSVLSFAGNPGDSVNTVLDQWQKIDSAERSFHYKTGKVVLQNGLGTLNVAPGFKFLEGREAIYVLEEMWGNLKGQHPLGIIVPESDGAILSDYAFILHYEDMGYVKDNDAKDINYDDLLKQLKEDSKESNKQRIAEGLQTIDVLGWASKPYYDNNRKILHWAKELKVGEDSAHTLNYDIRILGRKGVMVLQAVADMEMLDTVNKNLDKIIGMVSFNEGNRYSDFNSKTDDIAAWTIGGLVAGKVLAKVGFFAIILKYIKLIFVAIAAAGGGIWRFITGKRKKENEWAVQPVTNDETTV